MSAGPLIGTGPLMSAGPPLPRSASSPHLRAPTTPYR